MNNTNVATEPEINESEEMNYISNNYHNIANKPEYVCNLIREGKMESAKYLSHMIDDKRVNLVENLKPFHSRLNSILLVSNDDKVYDLVLNSVNALANALLNELSEENAKLIVKSLGTLYNNKTVETQKDLKQCMNMLGNMMERFSSNSNK